MIGFEALKSRLLNDFNTEKMHHAILLYGPKGIGKASFLRELCSEILQNKASELSDVRVISKPEDRKSISVKEIRDSHDFLHQASAVSDFKFLIIDSACELNRNAANAILKSLEEPKKNCFLFLVAHNLSQVLPTIRSRCLKIKAPELKKAEFLTILQKSNCEFSNPENEFLAEICNQAPAIAISQGAELINFYRQLLNAAKNGKMNEKLLKKLSDKNFSFPLFERTQMIFFHRLLTAKSVSSKKQKSDFQFFFEEAEIFQFLIPKTNIGKLIEVSQSNFKHCQTSSFLNLDKKFAAISCLENIFKSFQ